jgi:predicted Fe-Mo cluster-binding NifX family protein
LGQYQEIIMAHRLAITTRDGKVVQEHFGHARHFHIVDITDDGYRYLESREVDPLCTGEFPQEQTHGAARFAPVAALLSDCQAIVTAQIGPGASDYMIGQGFRIFQGTGFVDQILQQIISEKLLDGETK